VLNINQSSKTEGIMTCHVEITKWPKVKTNDFGLGHSDDLPPKLPNYICPYMNDFDLYEKGYRNNVEARCKVLPVAVVQLRNNELVIYSIMYPHRFNFYLRILLLSSEFPN